MIDRVLLRWEAAYGKEYTIQLSDNNTLWSIAAYQPNGDGGNDTIPIAKAGRYVKMFGMKRATQWGYSLYEFEVYGSLVTGVREGADGTMPMAWALFDNYPNPFNPLTIIKYTIGGNRVRGLGVGDVTLVVYDVLGRQVAVLVNERKAPGTYQVPFDGTGLASGVYIYRLTAGNFVQTKRMVLVK
jgi:hypothetical protein